MNPIRTSAGLVPAPDTAIAAVSRLTTAMPTLNGVPRMYLIHEALSRARMRLPQAGRTTASTEATRSARTVALEARRRAARELGIL
jgi:DTW domain-containing protein YfiP